MINDIVFLPVTWIDQPLISIATKSQALNVSCSLPTRRVLYINERLFEEKRHGLFKALENSHDFITPSTQDAFQIRGHQSLFYQKDISLIENSNSSGKRQLTHSLLIQKLLSVDEAFLTTLSSEFYDWKFNQSQA